MINLARQLVITPHVILFTVRGFRRSQQVTSYIEKLLDIVSGTLEISRKKKIPLSIKKYEFKQRIGLEVFGR